jgi:hypothetical protein
VPRQVHTWPITSISQFGPGPLLAMQTRAAYCCDLLSSSRSRTSSDTKRSARCHVSSLSPRNVKNFRNTTRWDVVSTATVHATCQRAPLMNDADNQELRASL